MTTTHDDRGEPEDEEVRTIGRIIDLLDPLPPATRRRALRYLADRYRTRTAAPPTDAQGKSTATQ